MCQDSSVDEGRSHSKNRQKGLLQRKKERFWSTRYKKAKQWDSHVKVSIPGDYVSGISTGKYRQGWWRERLKEKITGLISGSWSLSRQ